MNDEIRDSSGNLVGYDGKKIIGLEVMIATFQGRLERIESNQGDLKIIQNEMRKEMKDLSKKLDVFCMTFRETVSDVNAANKKSETALLTATTAQKTADDISLRIETFFSSLKFGSKITAAVVAVGGVILGIIEFLKK